MPVYNIHDYTYQYLNVLKNLLVHKDVREKLLGYKSEMMQQRNKCAVPIIFKVANTVMVKCSRGNSNCPLGSWGPH